MPPSRGADRRSCFTSATSPHSAAGDCPGRVPGEIAERGNRSVPSATLRRRYPVGSLGESFRVHPVVVLGEHGAGLAGPVGKGAPAYLAARDGERGRRQGE